MKYAVFTVGLPELTPEQAVATFEDLSTEQPLADRLRDDRACVKRIAQSVAEVGGQ